MTRLALSERMRTDEKMRTVLSFDIKFAMITYIVTLEGTVHFFGSEFTTAARFQPPKTVARRQGQLAGQKTVLFDSCTLFKASDTKLVKLRKCLVLHSFHFFRRSTWVSTS